MWCNSANHLCKSRTTGGPKTLPWGTPDATVTQELDWPSKMTFCVLPCRKSWIHARTVPAVSQCETLSSRRWCGTLSKALEKSSRMMSISLYYPSLWQGHQQWAVFHTTAFAESMLVLGWPFINRFALCYRTVVCRVLCVFPVCDAGVLSITWCSRTRSRWGLEAFRTLVSV